MLGFSLKTEEREWQDLSPNPEKIPLKQVPKTLFYWVRNGGDLDIGHDLHQSLKLFKTKPKPKGPQPKVKPHKN